MKIAHIVMETVVLLQSDLHPLLLSYINHHTDAIFHHPSVNFQDFLWLLPSRGQIQRFSGSDERHTALLESADEFEKAGCTFI